jgi:DUF1009 family protein
VTSPLTAPPVGLIAGAGDLPVKLAAHLGMSGKPVFVVALSGFASPALLARHPGAEAALGEIGKAIRLLGEAGCREIVFAGAVTKPNMASLKLDMQGVSLLPQLAAAAAKGDDALLRVVLGAFEKAGFSVIGADDVLADLLAPAGAIGGRTPSAADWIDIRAAAAAALDLGARDVGQGAVARDGAVVALEAQDGTDAMLSRLHGGAGGVLVKRPKPQQERRIDLPTIGPDTVRNAAAAGLAGVAVEAGGVLVLDRELVVEAADAAGLFVYGFGRGEL